MSILPSIGSIESEWYHFYPVRLSSLVAWYDASNAASVIESGGAVSEWRDRSGNGHHLVQSSASLKPTTGTRTLNGLNVIDFDAGTESMTVTSAALGGIFNGAGADFCIYAVYKSDSLVNNQYWLGSSVGYAAATDGMIAVHSAISDEVQTIFTGGGSASPTASFDHDTGPHLLSIECDGSTISQFVNGRAYDTADSSSVNCVGVDTFAVGKVNSAFASSASLDGVVAEIVILDSYASTADRKRVEGYLAHKWGVVHRMSYDHPYRWDGRKFAKSYLWNPGFISVNSWLDAADESSVELHSSGYVKVWRDKSGNENHFSMGTDSDMPLYTERLNRNRVVSSNGDDRSIWSLEKDGDWFQPPFKMYFVVRYDGDFGYIAGCRGVPSGADGWQLTWINASSTVRFTEGAPSPGVVIDITSPKVMLAAKDATTEEITGWDGTEKYDVETDLTYTGAGEEMKLFRDNSESTMDGIYAEIIFADHDISEAEEDKIVGYLHWKWGLEANLPAGHAYETEPPIIAEAVSVSEPEGPSGPWTPADIDTLSWHDADDAATIAASGGLVSQWNDKSGNANHFTQGTASNQPVTGTRTLNSLNVLDFAGGDWMEKTSFSIPNGDLCVFQVAIIDEITNQRDSLFSVDAASHDFQYEADGATFFRGALNVSDIGANAVPGNLWSGPNLFNVNMDWTGAGVYNSFVNGTQDITDTTYSSQLNTSPHFHLMTNRAMAVQLNGAVAEMVITEDTSTDTRQRIEGYLAHKWGLEGDLPGGHPYKSSPPTL